MVGDVTKDICNHSHLTMTEDIVPTLRPRRAWGAEWG